MNNSNNPSKPPKNESILPFSSILSASPSLQDLIQKTQELSKLNDIIQSIIDPQYAQYFQVSNLREGILILACSRPEWGHILRFSNIEILTALRQHPIGRGIKSIRIKVIPN